MFKRATDITCRILDNFEVTITVQVKDYGRATVKEVLDKILAHNQDVKL